MPVPQFVAALRKLATKPSSEQAEALLAMLRAEPDLAKAAKPALMIDPQFSRAYRVMAPSEQYQLNNTVMPTPRAIHRPTNLGSLFAIVEEAALRFRALKAAGDGWGFANAAATPDWLVHCVGLDDVLPLENDLHRTGATPPGELVRFQSGITFDKLNAYLWVFGRAVMQQPGFGLLTVVGCAAAGGHGSGLSYTGISGYIEAIELMTLDDANRARLLRIEPKNGLSDPVKWAARYPAPRFELVQDDGLFHAARCGQGNLGIVYAVTMRTQPAFHLVEDRTLGTWSKAWPQVKTALVDPKIHSVHVWINPYKADPTVIVTKLTRTKATGRQGQRGFGVRFGGMNAFTEAVRLLIAVAPETIPFLMDKALESCAATGVRMPCFEALDFGAPNSIPVNAASLGFDASLVEQVFPALVKEIQAWRVSNQWVSSPIGMRWVAGSHDYLSPQYGRDTVMLEVPIMKGTPNAVDTLDRYARYMMDTWSARPHWGQQNPMGRARFEKVYQSSLDGFLPAYRTLNPNGFFDGPLARQLGLRELSRSR